MFNETRLKNLDSVAKHINIHTPLKNKSRNKESKKNKFFFFLLNTKTQQNFAKCFIYESFIMIFRKLKENNTKMKNVVSTKHK